MSNRESLTDEATSPEFVANNKQPFHIRFARHILRTYANSVLTEYDEEETVFKHNGTEYTRTEIDATITTHFENTISLIDAAETPSQTLRAFINKHLETDRKHTTENEPIIEIDGNPLTPTHIDKAVTHHFETHSS